MICLKCKHLDDLRKNPKHTEVGVGVCIKLNEPGVFVSFNFRRDCSGFDAAADEVSQKRIVWYEGKARNDGSV